MHPIEFFHFPSIDIQIRLNLPQNYTHLFSRSPKWGVFLSKGLAFLFEPSQIHHTTILYDGVHTLNQTGTRRFTWAINPHSASKPNLIDDWDFVYIALFIMIYELIDIDIDLTLSFWMKKVFSKELTKMKNQTKLTHIHKSHTFFST